MSSSNKEVDLLFTSHYKSNLRVSTSAFMMDNMTNNMPYVPLPSNSVLTKTINDNIHRVLGNKVIKVRGVEWHPDNGMFKCNFSDIDYQHVPTKRILSFVSTLFDLFRWIPPFIILTKIILQELWKLQLSWEDPVPENIYQKRKFLH